MVQDVCFYINRTDFFGNSGAYRAKFTIKSDDKRFSTDNYFLRINNPLGEEKSLYSLGKRIDIKTIDYINPEDFFKDTSACETHNELSLINKGFSGIRIFIVANIHPRTIT
ncbi:hypothetical protein N7U66_10560 [Lacinutrix neustonica]|uniref:Uncharacterized protein n=1 Tax=Lacinutrix neustonica TaxID=2980107 RepID=A0A9E8SER0_9FLAO|nr:hypothetical protein [Lacinutrix neustonica]WAC03813.1 hypothetical protein N7U66_10560 [Lacinutrix neustonica]